MEFAAPNALLLGLVAMPVAGLGIRRRPNGIGIASAGAFASLPRTLRVRCVRWLSLGRGLAIILLVIALAQPRVGDANAVVPAEGIDVVLAIDLSSSMTTSFAGKTNRLEAAKSAARSFVKERKDDRIGLVVFQSKALTFSPPTLDHKALDQMLEKLDTGLLPDGTAIGLGITNSLNAPRGSTAATRTVILLTDGEHNTPSISPAEAAEVAAALKIRLYTIGVTDSKTSKEVDRNSLRAIAERTGGRYYEASDPGALAQVYATIGDLETSGVGREHFERFAEYGPWFAAAGAAVVLAELALRATWLRQIGA